MTSVDGNYLKMQGEASARMQVAYQAETQAQQVRAQAASEKALQRLREEVAAMASSNGQDRGMEALGERGEGSSENEAGSRRRKRSGDAIPVTLEGPPPMAGGTGTRFDVRV